MPTKREMKTPAPGTLVSFDCLPGTIVKIVGIHMHVGSDSDGWLELGEQVGLVVETSEVPLVLVDDWLYKIPLEYVHSVPTHDPGNNDR